MTRKMQHWGSRNFHHSKDLPKLHLLSPACPHSRHGPAKKVHEQAFEQFRAQKSSYTTELG